MIRDTAAAQERNSPVCNTCESQAQSVNAGVYTEPSNLAELDALGGHRLVDVLLRRAPLAKGSPGA